ncbi:MAG: hypothetical protein F4241_00440 [Rhodothermaceae bacterium]|nr:hypothetical protein [Rhodothermaceae bacterium]
MKPINDLVNYVSTSVTNKDGTVDFAGKGAILVASAPGAISHVSGELGLLADFLEDRPQFNEFESLVHDVGDILDHAGDDADLCGCRSRRQ